MSIKKKLGMGVLSAALGISLIGGGTWAAFNDTATINNHFAAGTLDLVVGKSANKPISFDLSNMKPGDNVQRIFTLRNAGTLAIKEVLLSATASNYAGNADADSFLAQFEINFMNVDSETNEWQPRQDVIKPGETLTLADLVAGPAVYASKINPDFLATDGSQRINLAALNLDPANSDFRGIPVDPTDTDDVFIQITFIDDPTKDANGEYVQNIYQGSSIDFFFHLEATQWDGVHVDSHNGNGEINNGVQGSADGPSMPNPVTKGTPTHSQEVVD